jgi:hypothetical protein
VTDARKRRRRIEKSRREKWKRQKVSRLVFNIYARLPPAHQYGGAAVVIF